MQINGPSQAHGAQSLSGPHFLRRTAEAPQQASPQTADQIEISAEASEAARLAEAAETRASEHAIGPDGIRTGLVNRLKAEIASGTYESGDKLDTALDRLLDEVG